MKKYSVLILTAVCGIGILITAVTEKTATGQDETNSGFGSAARQPSANVPSADRGTAATAADAPAANRVRTLDDIRRLPTSGGPSGTAPAAADHGFGGSGDDSIPFGGGDGFDGPARMGSDMSGMSGMASGMDMGKSVPDPRTQALNKVRQHRRALASGRGDRRKTEEKLRQALQEYFLADMQQRVRELDEIKKRVTDMEAKLNRRLTSRDEVVDLQFRLLLHEVDGLGFFAPGHSLEPADGGGFAMEDMMGGGMMSSGSSSAPGGGGSGDGGFGLGSGH